MYQTAAWQSLPKISRAQVLLVAEGLKRGTYVSATSELENLLPALGLESQPNLELLVIPRVLAIAKETDLRELRKRTLLMPQDARSPSYWALDGWFLGYPDCCITEYSRDRTPEEKEEIARGGEGYRFAHEMAKRKTYPDYLDYRPPSFTPCSVDCPESAKLLTSWKDVLVRLDSQAAELLARFGRRNAEILRGH